MLWEIEMDKKYLSDGRKVAVIGQLNNQESIVQEIFVTESGDEIPSGERFTTKSLHDAPVKSYKQKEEERATANIASLKGEVDKINREISESRRRMSAWKDMFKSAENLSGRIDSATLETLDKFFSGRINFVVETGWRPLINDLVETVSDEDNWGGRIKYDGLKLISLMGKSDGDLEFRLNQYRDGSGSSRVVSFCETIEEARGVVHQAYIDSLQTDRPKGLDYVLSAIDLGVQFEKGDILDLVKKAIKSKQSAMDEAEKKHKESILQSKESIDNLKALIA
jgi:hypothetical protein